MNTIWKAELPLEGEFSLELPAGAVFLAVQTQGDNPKAWFVVNTKSELEERFFELLGTGHELQRVDQLRYLGTFQILDGRFVGHLFERKR